MRHLILCTIFFFYCLSSLAEVINIRLFLTNYDPIDKDRIQDKRSQPIIPIVILDKNTIYVYSNSPIDNLKLVIKDSCNNIVYFDTISLNVSDKISILLEHIESGEYRIELEYENQSLYGYFLID